MLRIEFPSRRNHFQSPVHARFLTFANFWFSIFNILTFKIFIVGKSFFSKTLSKIKIKTIAPICVIHIPEKMRAEGPLGPQYSLVFALYEVGNLSYTNAYSWILVVQRIWIFWEILRKLFNIMLWTVENKTYYYIYAGNSGDGQPLTARLDNNRQS